MTHYTIDSIDGKRYRVYRPYLDVPEKQGQGDKAFPAIYEAEGDREHFYVEWLSSELGQTGFSCYATSRNLGWGEIPYTEDVPQRVPYYRKGAYLRGWGPDEVGR